MAKSLISVTLVIGGDVSVIVMLVIGRLPDLAQSSRECAALSAERVGATPRHPAPRRDEGARRPTRRAAPTVKKVTPRSLR